MLVENHNKILNEIESLKDQFDKTATKLIKDIKRQDKIMKRSDKRQLIEYDTLQLKLEEVEKLQQSQKDLLESFIKILATAIDDKSAYTGKHCSRVPQLSMMIVKEMDKNEDIFKNFKINNDDELREIEIAAWLHDCGKVVTPEYVVDKSTKLETIYNRIHEIRTRFEVIKRDKKIEALEKELAGEDKNKIDAWLEQEYKDLEDDYAFIAKHNIGVEYMDDKDITRIEQISQRVWERTFDNSIGISYEEKLRLTGSVTPCIENVIANKREHIIDRVQDITQVYEKYNFKTPLPEHLYNLGEIYNLTIKSGTLSDEERYKVQEHIMITIKMLEELPFPKYLQNVPLYAGAHHETLCGTGYPRSLSEDDLPIPARILAIADIFEALTAADRPYKTPKTLNESINILNKMAKERQIDPDIFKLFVDSKIYLKYAQKYLKPEQIDKIDLTDF